MFRLKGWALLALAVISLVLVLVLASGGGSHHGQRTYKVTLPTGRVVTQAHSPALATPKPTAELPKAFVPVATPQPSSAPVKALAHVSALARVLPAHAADVKVKAAAVVAISTVEQFDSVTTSTIPSTAHYVAGYVNGSWPTYWKLRGHYPVVVGIAVSRGAGADCFDMEPGNPDPTAAGPWAKWQMTQGNPRPCEYSMLSWMPAIKANLAAWHIPLCSSSVITHCVRLWDANWTQTEHLDSGYFCTQWTDHAYNLNLDESTCLTSFYVAPVVKVPCFGKGAQVHAKACAGIRPHVARLTRERKADQAQIIGLRQTLVRGGCRRVVQGGPVNFPTFTVRPGRNYRTAKCKAEMRRGDALHARIGAINVFVNRALVARY